MTPSRIRFVAPLALLALAACKQQTSLDDGEIPQAADDGGALPTAASDAGAAAPGQPFDWTSLFPARDAGRGQAPVDAGSMSPSSRESIGPMGATPNYDGIALIVPRGAVTRTIQVTFAELPSPPAGFTGRAYLLSPPETQFAVPVQVAIQLTPEVLAKAPANAWAVATLQNGAWVALPNQTNQKDDVLVLATTSTLGAFALIQVEPRPDDAVPTSDAGAADAGMVDAASEPVDAAVDAEVDAASVDAAVDAGPVPFCQLGACANGTCVEGLTDFGCACNAGFTLAPDLHSCADVDECALGSLACTGGKVCSNVPGSAQCVCPPGTELTPADTCAAPGTYCLPTSCAPGTCAEANGDFACTCPAGYGGTGTKACADNDECMLGTAGCAPGATCVNSAGSYSCSCDAPNILHGDGTCSPGFCVPGTCANGICSEGPSTYVCSCNPGFEGSGTQACADIDECTVGTAACAAYTNCINDPGTYRCECLPPNGLIDGVCTPSVAM